MAPSFWLRAELRYNSEVDDEAPRDQLIFEVCYADVLDSYLLNCNFKIYRKDIDENPAYLYMDLKCIGNN